MGGVGWVGWRVVAVVGRGSGGAWPVQLVGCGMAAGRMPSWTPPNLPRGCVLRTGTMTVHVYYENNHRPISLPPFLRRTCTARARWASRGTPPRGRRGRALGRGQGRGRGAQAAGQGRQEAPAGPKPTCSMGDVERSVEHRWTWRNTHVVCNGRFQRVGRCLGCGSLEAAN